MSFRLRALPFLLVTACQGAGGPSVPELEAPAISGTVVDASGRAVPGARVALVPMGLFDPSGAVLAHVDSAADGSFRFAAPGDSRYGVTATAPDRTAAWVADVRAGATALRLQLGDEGRRLSGRVIDRGGRPRPGAEVRLARGLGDNGDVFLVSTTDSGLWSARVPEGDYAAHALLPPDWASAPRALSRDRDSVDLVLDPVWPPGPPPAAVVAWVRAHEIPLATVEAGHGLADLAPLRAIVGKARAVGLGEATHGTREIFQLKHRMLEYLVGEMGFTVLAIETGLPESFAIDDYVLGGPGDAASLLAAESPVWQAEELGDVVRWMRAWNRTHARKVHFQGLDMRKGGVAARETLAYLERTDRAMLASPFVEALAPVADPALYPQIIRRPKPELAGLAAQARELVAWLESQRARYVARSGAETWWRAVMQARALAQLFEWLAAGDTRARVLVRERAMADNALRALEHRGPGARAVVWAHNAHVSRNPEAEPPMMGVHLGARLGADYRAIGSVLGRGSYQAFDATARGLKDFTIAPAAAGSLEDTLAAAGPPIALLDLRALPPSGTAAAWFRAFQVMRQFDGLYDDERPSGWASARTIVAREFDALSFVAVGTAARKRRALPSSPQR
jgi:erythromycin esterase